MHYYEWFMQKHIKIIIIIARKCVDIYRLFIHQVQEHNPFIRARPALWIYMVSFQ